MFGVYRVLRNGTHKYISCTATHSEKLATEIARDLSLGIVTMPDGSQKSVKAFPHIAKPINR